MTLRIFFWSNFLGRPWTVVKVLRPLRSGYENHKFQNKKLTCSSNKRLTLDPYMDVILRLICLPCLFVVGEGVYEIVLALGTRSSYGHGKRTQRV